MLKFIAPLAVLLSATAAQAKSPTHCEKRETLVPYLLEKYGERLIWFGINENEVLVELFANPSSQSWTLVMTDRTGKSCVNTDAMTGRGYLLEEDTDA